MLTFPTRYLIVLLGALILVAACSSPLRHQTPPVTGQEQALKYAQCMRANGVPGFPDPDPNGRFRGVGHEQQDNPKFRAAQQACRDLAPGGQHEKFGDPAFVEQARKFAQCIRANGVPGFPDPDAEGRFRGVGHEQQNNPKFRAAFEACHAKLPGGGEHR
jgi:hypothetical protein